MTVGYRAAVRATEQQQSPACRRRATPTGALGSGRGGGGGGQQHFGAALLDADHLKLAASA